jgi:hypothetical protein
MPKRKRLRKHFLNKNRLYIYIHIVINLCINVYLSYFYELFKSFLTLFCVL